MVKIYHRIRCGEEAFYSAKGGAVASRVSEKMIGRAFFWKLLRPFCRCRGIWPEVVKGGRLSPAAKFKVPPGGAIHGAEMNVDFIKGRDILKRMKTVYVETSVFSYLTAKPSANLVAAARQRETLDWWELSRPRFDIFISLLVEEEARRGDSDAARRRLDAMRDLSVLEITSEVSTLATFLLKNGALPPKAADDAAHVAIAAIHRMDYLLTWNCRHIDNAEMKPIIRAACESFGVPCPEICTPGELMGGGEYV